MTDSFERTIDYVRISVTDLLTMAKWTAQPVLPCRKNARPCRIYKCSKPAFLLGMHTYPSDCKWFSENLPASQPRNTASPFA